MITLAFALGHGVMLLVFAKVLQVYGIPESITHLGDTIAAVVILSMGAWMLLQLFMGRVGISTHIHENKQHRHIYLGTGHTHTNSTLNAWSMGAFMGLGGVRGMLLTLSVVHTQEIGLTLVGAFVAGVSVVFVLFGLGMMWLNTRILATQQGVRIAFSTAGVLSLAVGAHLLL